MRLTAWLWKNLNIAEWNRRVWEIGYRGPPIPKLKMYVLPKFMGFLDCKKGHEI